MKNFQNTPVTTARNVQALPVKNPRFIAHFGMLLGISYLERWPLGTWSRNTQIKLVSSKFTTGREKAEKLFLVTWLSERFLSQLCWMTKGMPPHCHLFSLVRSRFIRWSRVSRLQLKQQPAFDLPSNCDISRDCPPNLKLYQNYRLLDQKINKPTL